MASAGRDLAAGTSSLPFERSSRNGRGRIDSASFLCLCSGHEVDSAIRIHLVDGYRVVARNGIDVDIGRVPH
jgi:hypothetical protein